MAANYYYDARGNQTSKTSDSTVYNRSIGYSADDHAHELVSGNGQRTRFWYGSDGQRYKREDGSKRTLYLGNVEIVTGIGATTIKRTLAGALLQTIIGSTASHQYLFHDQLGNLARITDANGAVLNTQDYTAFGERRDPATQLPGGSAPTLTTRGFTGHEYVDGLDVIHMNGRIYDQTLGRFLQADPLIQAPDNAQSWNAYTYCFNNPLTYTDPSGMIGMKERQWLGFIIAVVASVVSGQYWVAGNYWAAFGVAVAGGFASGAVATGTMKGGLQGAFTAALTFGAGYLGRGLDIYSQMAVQAVSGGVIESLQGGNFGHGFIAAGLTAAFMPQAGSGKMGERAVKGALIGGTISELTGGKFANGAVSGAIQGAMSGSPQDDSEQQNSLGSDPLHIRDNVIVNPAIQSSTNPLTGELLLRVPYNVEAGTPTSFESQFVSTVEGDLTRSFTNSLTGESIKTRVELYRPVELNAKTAFILGRCPASVCTSFNNVQGFWDPNMRSLAFRTNAPQQTKVHEFLHSAGLGHQHNFGGSLLSYSPSRTLQYTDMRRLYDAYNK